MSGRWLRVLRSRGDCLGGMVVEGCSSVYRTHCLTFSMQLSLPASKVLPESEMVQIVQSKLLKL